MIIHFGSFLKPKFKSWHICLPLKNYSILSSDEKLISLLKSCNKTSEITQIHGSMVKTGLDLVTFPLSKLLASSIIDITYAASIFKHIQNPNLFMFNTLLRGYSISDYPEQAFVLFNHTRALNVFSDQFTFISVIKSCARVSAVSVGCGIHSLVLQSGYNLFINVRNTLLHLYCICGRIGDAHQLFDEFPQERDLVSWNTLMGGYLRASQLALVLGLFRQLYKDDANIGVTTMLSVLSAIGDLGDVSGGDSLHGYCLKYGFCFDLNVATALISMYGKMGRISSGHKVFDEVIVKDVVLWNCLMDSYAKSGMLEESLALLQSMKLEEGLMPNSSTLAGLLLACANSGALGLGQAIHNFVEEQKIELNPILGTALVDMYSKCGVLKKAIDVFDNMERKDVKSWTAMISSYGIHGQAKNAILLFHRMEEEGCKPNEVTFLAVLSACSHGGLVNEGVRSFESLVQDYGLKPKVEHYGCIIDLLGRAGLLEEAYNLIKSLPIESDATAWRALLAACRVYGDVNLGECVKKELEEICDDHPADSVVLLSTYAIAGRITEGRNGRGESKYSSICKKEVGCSSIELDSTL